MLLADLHAVAPARVPNGSIAGWFLLVVVLAGLAAAGVFLAARR